MAALIILRVGDVAAPSVAHWVIPNTVRFTATLRDDVTGAPITNAVGVAFAVEFSDGRPPATVPAVPSDDPGEWTGAVYVGAGAALRVQATCTTPAVQSAPSQVVLRSAQAPTRSPATALVSPDGELYATDDGRYYSAQSVAALPSSSVATLDMALTAAKAGTDGRRRLVSLPLPSLSSLIYADVEGPAVEAARQAGAESGTTAGASAGATAGATQGAQAGATAGSQAGATSGATAGAQAGAQAGTTAGTAAGASAGTTAGATAGSQAGATAGATAGQQAADAAMASTSFATSVVRNAAGVDIQGAPLKFNAPSGSDPREGMNVGSLPTTPWQSAVATPFAKTLGGGTRDEFDLNEEFGFRNNDSSADIPFNNAAWTAFANHVNAWNAANPGKTATYKVNKRQVWQFDQKVNAIPRCKLILNGTTLMFAGAPSRSVLHNVAAGCDVDTLTYYARDLNEWYRTAAFGVATDTLRTKIGELRVDSDRQFINRPAVGGSRFDCSIIIAQGNIEFGKIDIRRQDYALSLNSQATTVYDVSINDLLIALFRVGVTADNVQRLLVKLYEYRGSSPNATPDPGQNALLLNSIVGGQFLKIFGFGSGEHAIRCGGATTAPITTADLEFGDLTLDTPGQCGLKLWNSDISKPIRNVRVDKIDVTDSGSYRETPGYNDFPCMLENVIGMKINRVSVRPKNRTYSAYDGIYIAGAEDLTIVSAEVTGAARHSVFITPYINGAAAGFPDGTDPSFNRDIRLLNLSSKNPVQDHLAVLEAPGFDVYGIMARLDVEGGRDAVRWTGNGETTIGNNFFEVAKKKNLGGVVCNLPYSFEKFIARDLTAPPSPGLELIAAGRYVGTLTRSGDAAVADGAGGFVSVPANTPRHLGAERRLRLEGARTNLLLNSATLSTQSVTVTAQAYALAFTGTGTITLSGAATGTLAGVGSSARTPALVFTPAAGSLVLTVTGDVRFAQLEAGPFATSWIPSAASSGVRGTEFLTTPTVTIFPQKSGTLLFSVVFSQAAASGSDQLIFTVDDNSSANRLLLSNSGGSSNINFNNINAAGGGTGSSVGAMTAGRRLRGAMAFDASGLDIQLEGDTVRSFTTPIAVDLFTNLRMGNVQTATANRSLQGDFINARALPYRAPAAMLAGLIGGLQ